MRKQAKRMVPMSLATDNPLLYYAACAAHSQREADRYIRRAYPDWRGWQASDLRGKGVRQDFQAAGTYSLNLTAGGGRYHQAGKPVQRCVNAPQITGAVFTVEAPETKPHTNHRIYPKGTRRLPGRHGGMHLP